MDHASSPPRDPVVELPPVAARALRLVPDGRMRARLFQVLRAAVQAVGELRDLDLSRQEEALENPGAHLWDEVAAAVSTSVNEVGKLLTVVSAQFPATAEEQTCVEDFDLLGPAPDAPAATPESARTPADRMRSAEEAVRLIADVLRMEASRFGSRVRSPHVLADRWNLLAELQEFRGRCRAAVGELVFSVCNAFVAVERAEVVPEYDIDLAVSLAVRNTVQAFTRIVEGINARMRAASHDERVAMLRELRGEVDELRVTVGYKWMRAGDKRFIVQFRQDLDRTLEQGSSVAQAHLLIEGFTRFLESLAVINKRELLVNHDRAHGFEP